MFSAKLYIESVDSGSSVIHEINGKYYTDIIDGDAPTPSNFIVNNGATAGASIQLREDSDNGSNFVALKGRWTQSVLTSHLHYHLQMVLTDKF